jgi:hypothetical protein
MIGSPFAPRAPIADLAAVEVLHDVWRDHGESIRTRIGVAVGLLT